MRFRRIVVVLAALLALGFGSATVTPSAGVFSTKTACVCVVTDRDQAPVRPGRIEVDATRPGSPVLPVCLRAAWVDAAVRFQLPPPVRA
jgi:hypothetical protein